MSDDASVLDELGFYTLAGQPDSSRALVDEVRLDQLDPPIEALLEMIQAASSLQGENLGDKPA